MTPKHILLTLLFACILSAEFAVAQPTGRVGTRLRRAVYRSPEDSVTLALLLHELSAENEKKKPNLKRADSLAMAHVELAKTAILRYEVIYLPTREYTRFATLHDSVNVDQVTALTLERVSRIPRRLSDFNNLHTLELVNTSIKKLHRRLKKIPGLTNIEIFNNDINRPLALSRLKSVRHLTLNGCEPDALPRSYKNLKGLTLLDIAENKLTKLPNGLTRNRKLLEINAQSNLLNLTEDMPGHPKVERLSLQHNQITRVPAAIRRYPGLIRLSLNYNLVSEVDPAIVELKHLQFVSFYVNRLTEIPAAVYRIRSLKVIDLFYNEIEKLDTTLMDWGGLEILYLSHNKLVILPDNIDDLKNLRGLYIDHNRIDRLPASVGNIDSLEVLKVNHNFLKEVPASVLQLTALEELDISNNYISDISPALFDFKNYKIFSLANNPWSSGTKKFLMTKVKELRGKNVAVHVLGELDH